MTGGSSSDTPDPNLLVTNTDGAMAFSIYDTLLWLDADAQPYSRLAQEMMPNKDATAWTIRLRRGVTFHNGKPLTADDLIYSIRRVLNPKAPGIAATALHGLNASGMKKLDNLTVIIPFAKPYATFPAALASETTVYVIPEGFNPKQPVGTGPFKLANFTPGRQAVLARNENYWDTPLPYLDHVIMTDYPDETSQVNALLGGQIDVAPTLSQQTSATVTGSGKVVVISPGGGWNPITMRFASPPFNDVRVRQAFRLAVDREKMLQTVFGGHGTIGNDIFSIWDPQYDHNIPQRTYDPEKAKSLLKAAGQENLSVTLVTADIAQGVNNASQVYAQQASAAGINVKVNTVTATELYGPNYSRWAFAVDFFYYVPYFTQVSETLLPTSPFNATGFNNSKYFSLYAQALATLDESLRTEIAHEMQMIDYNEGAYIIPFFPPVFDGHAPNVSGIVRSKTGVSLNTFDYKHMWLS